MFFQNRNRFFHFSKTETDFLARIFGFKISVFFPHFSAFSAKFSKGSSIFRWIFFKNAYFSTILSNIRASSLQIRFQHDFKMRFFNLEGNYTQILHCGKKPKPKPIGFEISKPKPKPKIQYFENRNRNRKWQNFETVTPLLCIVLDRSSEVFVSPPGPPKIPIPD